VHDLEVKINHARRFLEEGNKVKITCRFRGREITHPEAAERQLHAVVDRTKDLAMVELTPRMEGRNMTLVMAPVAKTTHTRPKPRAMQSAQDESP
jgi:translation initiation factor IF-3